MKGDAFAAGAIWWIVVALPASMTVALAGFDSLVVLLEFQRLAEYTPLVAVPLWLLCWHLLRLESGSWISRLDRGTGPWLGLAAAFLPPGLLLLLFSIAADVLAPRQAPSFESLLQIAVWPGLVSLGLVAWQADDRHDLARVWCRWRYLPPAVLLLALIPGWLSASTVAALVAVWLIVLRGPVESRIGRREMTTLLVGSVSSGALIVVGFWLMVVWTSLADDLGLLQGLLNGLIPGLLLGGLVAAGWLCGMLLGRTLPAMAVLAAPAVAVGAQGDVSLVWAGLSLSGAVALGAALRRTSP